MRGGGNRRVGLRGGGKLEAICGGGFQGAVSAQEGRKDGNDCDGGSETCEECEFFKNVVGASLQGSFKTGNQMGMPVKMVAEIWLCT